jgi:hypothetical protein
MKLDLSDLKPQEAEFKLSEKPEKTYRLKKFTLATRIWINERFGKDKIKTLFENQSMPEVSEVVYFMLKDKSDFPTLNDFQEAVVTQADFISLFESLLTSVGLSEPIIEKIAQSEAQESGNAPSPNQPIGAKSST